MTKPEWITRCAARFVATGGASAAEAKHLARVCAEAQFDKFGASAVAWQVPEAAADLDMLDWDDE